MTESNTPLACKTSVNALFAFLIASLSVGSVLAADPVGEAYFGTTPPKLNPQEKQTLEAAGKWKSVLQPANKPQVASNGSVQFVYGTQQPTVVCAPLQLCDIELQQGERLNGLDIADPVRWELSPAVTGSGSNEVIHILVKPKDVGLDTSLIVTTNRRIYHIRLKSHRTEFMHRVGFLYPDEAMRKFEQIKSRERQDRADRTLPETGEYLGDLNFDYSIEGQAPFKPVRVFNDGRKTVIQLPQSVSQTDAPTLLVLRDNAGFFDSEENNQVMVNYRVQGDRYIVENLFEKAILISGVGKQQTRITITKGSK